MSNAILKDKDIFQLGIVVADYDNALAHWKKLLGKEPDAVGICGSKEGGTAKQACFNLPNTMIEILAPDTGDSVWRRHLAVHGPGIQHIAIRFSEPAKALAALNAGGFATTQESEHRESTFGNAYVDAFPALGVDLEVLGDR